VVVVVVVAVVVDVDVVAVVDGDGIPVHVAVAAHVNVNVNVNDPVERRGNAAGVEGIPEPRGRGPVRRVRLEWGLGPVRRDSRTQSRGATYIDGCASLPFGVDRTAS
jgi:hypothetical protein